MQGVRKVEACVGLLLLVIIVCFIIEFAVSHVRVVDVLEGMEPRITPGSLYYAIGLVGAVVMPHNLFLHSALVMTRRIERRRHEIAEACKYNLIESAIALMLSFVVNVSIVAGT